MKEYQEIINKIREAKNILIVSHVGPDGDTIGSTLGLSNIIKDNFYDKNVVYVVQHKLPDIYSFLPNKDNITFDNREVKISCFDLAIGLDCATKQRMSYFENIYNKAKFKINIDHHSTNLGFGDINVINPNVSSCGEIIYDFAEKTGLHISLDTAICLYTALLTDTGAFRYSNTTSKTFATASRLVEIGVNPQKIYEYCFESRPVEMFKISSYALANAKFLANDKIAYTIVTRDDLAKFNALDEHLEGIPEILRQASSVEVSFLVKQTIKNEAKFSFRSKSKNVASLCENFGGGGHKCAAGCLLDTSIDDALEKVLPEVLKLVED